MDQTVGFYRGVQYTLLDIEIANDWVISRLGRIGIKTLNSINTIKAAALSSMYSLACVRLQ